MRSPKMRRAAAADKPPGPARRARALPPVPDPADAPRIAEIFRRFQAREPEPLTELTYTTPFTLLVAVVLSAQATDVSVNKATTPLFATVNTPAAMLALGEERLREAIKTIGLYNSKAKNVIALCERLVREFGGDVPRERAVLETLPGVGRKTAAVVVNALHGDAAIAVDTHVFRVSNRMPIAPGATPDAVEAGLLAAVPPPFVRHAHHWLILHGRYTCIARKPLCPTCIVADLCRWPDKTA
jgi:endonuclease III